MRKTPTGTAVGVDDPYEVVERCDHLTDEGRCRYAFERFERDPAFSTALRENDYRCPVVASDQPLEPFGAGRIDDGEDGDRPVDHWSSCPHFRCRKTDRSCVRCGLEERRIAHEDQRPLLEEHHLSYADGGRTLAHEITVTLCRWCHARVHRSWARLDDDVSPSPEAIAELEGRRSRELEELDFSTAADRYSRIAGTEADDGGHDGETGERR